MPDCPNQHPTVWKGRSDWLYQLQNVQKGPINRLWLTETKDQSHTEKVDWKPKIVGEERMTVDELTLSNDRLKMNAQCDSIIRPKCEKWKRMNPKKKDNKINEINQNYVH